VAKRKNQPRRPPRIMYIGPSLGHNYQLKMAQMLERGELEIKPGASQHINIAHDSWCNVYRGEFCNCDPDISLTDEYD
jgi:hypothetical protein